MYVLTLEAKVFCSAKKFATHMDALFSYIPAVKEFIADFGMAPTSITLEFFE